MPYPPDKGDRIRTFHTLRNLAKNHHVHLACLADEAVPKETEQVLQGLCEQVAIVPIQTRMRKLKMAWSILSGGIASVTAFRSKALSSIIKTWSDEIEFDLALASSSSTAPYLEATRLHDVPSIIDLVDVDSEKWLNYSASAAIPKRWIYQLEGKALRKYEQQISAWAQAVLLVSEAESQLFRKFAPHAAVHTITNGVDLDYFQPGQETTVKHQCVFVGALDYLPNIDAVCWFANKVWPSIRKMHADAVVQIVGRRPVPAVQALAQIPGVEVVGQVPDVRPYVERAAVVIAPLRIARGLQNKVLEALAMAKPVVASPAALAGLHLHTSNPAVQVDSDENWVTLLGDLFSNDERRLALGKQGREYVEKHYHWDRCLEPLQQLIASITESKNAARMTRSPSTVAV